MGVNVPVKNDFGHELRPKVRVLGSGPNTPAQFFFCKVPPGHVSLTLICLFLLRAIFLLKMDIESFLTWRHLNVKMKVR